MRIGLHLACYRVIVVWLTDPPPHARRRPTAAPDAVRTLVSRLDLDATRPPSRA